MSNPITRALMTAVVSAAITCERRPQCGRVLDKRKAVSFVLVTEGEQRYDMVTCADCYDTHIATMPDDTSLTVVDVVDGRRLWPRNRHPRVTV